MSDSGVPGNTAPVNSVANTARRCRQPIISKSVAGSRSSDLLLALHYANTPSQQVNLMLQLLAFNAQRIDSIEDGATAVLLPTRSLCLPNPFPKAVAVVAAQDFAI